MFTIEQWLQEYEASHRNRINKITHWFCVPAIMFSIIGLLWNIDTPSLFAWLPFGFNWAILLVVASILYYALLSVALAFGMVLVCTIMVALVLLLESLPVSLWQFSLLLFVLAWTGQFIGHRIEGRKPSFFRDVQFLLIGPLWLLACIYRRLGIGY